MTPRKPRKMPKNQRAYPKKGKPRMVEVTPEQAGSMTGIGAPHVYSNRVGSRIHFWANADEFRRYTNTPFSEPT